MSGEAGMARDRVDCLVVGAGPAGLTASIYLARFLLSVVVVDGGASRAALIPRTRNHAGYPHGIPGRELLAAMREQAVEHGVRIVEGEADAIEQEGEAFVVTVAGRTVQARAVLIATGVVNHRPAMPDALHHEALFGGLLRYCPVCDGYEVTDKRVAALGTGGRGTNEALFLRSYTRDVTLVAPDGAHDLEPADRVRLAEAGVVVVDGPATGYRIEDGQFCFDAADGRLGFDSVYPAMGSHIRSELAVALGARASADGCMEVDDHQRTSIPGLYAAGDVVKGLDQISHAMGEGGVAATTMRNDLANKAPLRR
jgi:thioredoxin reductase (NADPH)